MSVYFYGCITMDGYLADKAHNLDWLHQTGTAEETGYEQFYGSMDVVIMGKRTFREIENAENAEELYPTTRNYVFTHSVELSQSGFTAVNGDMVDCIIIQIAPVLLGAGIPLFTQKEELKRFQLKEVKRYGQFAELVYERGVSL